MTKAAKLYGQPRQASILIEAGTKVLSQKGMVALRALVIVDAVRQIGGCWRYTVAGTQYECGGGCARVLGAPMAEPGVV